MKGLLYKDLFIYIKNLKSLIFIEILSFAFLAFSNGSMEFVVFLYSLIISNIGVSILSLDELSRWDVYCQTLPVSRATQVSSKYIITLANNALYLLLITLYILLTHPENIPLVPQLATSVFMLPAFLYPFMFRFGVVKGRIVYIIVYATVGTLCGLAYVVSDNMKFSLPGFIPLIFVILFFVSWGISILLYKSRKF